MIIDVTSFTSGARQIENAVETQKNANHIAVAGRINGYIERLQSDFLKQAVGMPLASQIDEYSRVEHEEKDETMEALIASLKEPFADFVFFYMLRDMNSQPTITGLVQLKCANSYVSPLDKGVQIWNHMVDEMRCFVGDADALGVEGVVVDKNLLTYINQFNL